MSGRLTLREMRDHPELTALLERAKSHVMTPEEREAQRFSWVLGEMMLSHPEWTREEAVAFVTEAMRERGLRASKPSAPVPLTMEEWTVIVQALDRAEDYLAVHSGKVHRADCLARLRKAIPLALQGRDALANGEARR